MVCRVGSPPGNHDIGAGFVISGDDTYTVEMMHGIRVAPACCKARDPNIMPGGEERDTHCSDKG